mmetsp:Transcript_23254/g.35206  ORF Transcript_23254/g.35206 Transcript_23254/m.35206 type:complete len:122 (+) Transcript_23254:135-500(+)
MSESFDQQVSEFHQEEDNELDQLERMSMSVSLDQEVTDEIQSPAEAEVTRQQQKQQQKKKPLIANAKNVALFDHFELTGDPALKTGEYPCYCKHCDLKILSQKHALKSHKKEYENLITKGN